MAQSLDIQDVIQKSTSQVALKDLSKKGFRHVNVLNQATISRLIAEAVDKVIAERFQEISSVERQKVIDASKQEFDALAKERIKEQGEIGKLQAENETFRAEIETLRGRVDASLELQAERDQAIQKSEDIESKLSEVAAKAAQHIEQLEASLDTARETCTEKERELAKIEASVEVRESSEREQSKSLNEEVASLRERLSESDRAIAKYEGLLAAKNEEIDRMGQAAEETATKVSEDLEKRLEAMSVKSGADEQLMKSLEGIQQNIQNISVSGGKVRKLDASDAEAMVAFAERGSDDTAVETNIEKVEVKQAKAGGVKSTLAKLKELQKGVQNDDG